MVFNIQGRLVDTRQIQDVTEVELHYDNCSRFTGGNFIINFIGDGFLKIVTKGWYWYTNAPAPKERITIDVYDRKGIENVYNQVISFWKGNQSTIPQIKI